MTGLLGLAFIVLIAYLALLQGAHEHRGASWDGHHEKCSCGVSAGDKRGPDGNRYSFFSEWP